MKQKTGGGGKQFSTASPVPTPTPAQRLLNLWFRFLPHCSGQNKPSLAPTTTSGPSQPQHSPSARAQAPELLLPLWTSVVRRSNSAHRLKTSSVHTASGYRHNKPHEAGTGERRQNPARYSARHSAWLCSRRARLKTKNQGQARTPNATLTHTDIHDSVCGNAGRRHACLVTSLPGSAPGIRNWRARPWSVASSAPELRVPWFLARRRALWTCERARRVGARC